MKKIIGGIVLALILGTTVLPVLKVNAATNQSEEYEVEYLSEEEYIAEVAEVTGKSEFAVSIMVESETPKVAAEGKNLLRATVSSTQYARFAKTLSTTGGAAKYGFYATIYNKGSFREFITVHTSFMEGGSITSYNATSTKVSGTTVHFYASYQGSSGTSSSPRTLSDYFYLY